MAILDYTSDLRQLERLCEEQAQALKDWQEETATEFDDHLAVRYRDLDEHIQRVFKFATAQKQRLWCSYTSRPWRTAPTRSCAC